MKKYMVLFVGGKAPEDQEANMKRWGVWMMKLGENGKWDSGLPFGHGKRVTGVELTAVDYDGMDANATSGYAILNADTIDEAVKLTDGCPLLEDGGMHEVRELMEM